MLTYKKLLEQLDRLYCLPLAKNETAEMRADAIEAMVQASGWTWDQILAKMAEPEGN
jgi:hypothetical protein